jgi:phosphoribosylanthranilate isomerase
MNETKLTLSVTHEDKTTTASVSRPEWDADVYQLADMFESLLLAGGFHPDNIKEILKDEQ